MIIGNSQGQKILLDLLKRDRGTILVFGPQGVGKYSFLQSVLQNEPGEKVILDNSSKFFSLDTARLLISLGNQKKERLIILVNEAHKFSTQAQNIFLKTIEEALTPTIFIFVTHQLTKILPTIRSRSFLVRFSLVSPEETFKFLQSRGYSESEIKLAMLFYPYQPGKALSLLENKNKLKLLKKFFTTPIEDRLLLLEEIKKHFSLKELLELYLLMKRKNIDHFSLEESRKIREILDLYNDLDYNLNNDLHLADLILNHG